MLRTKNCSLKTDPKLACTCDHPSCDQRIVRPRVLNQTQNIRDDYGRPMIITSGGRCPNHPDEKHKTKPGDHQQCYAIDVFYRTELERNKLMVLAGRHGVTRVAVGGNFIHMAWTPTPDRSVPTWSY